MRNEFLEVATLEQANKLAPWAAEIVEVEGGFQAFESIDDYNRWLVETDYELADIDLPGGQGESVLLTEGGVVSGAGKVYGVFADLADATAGNADQLVLATIGGSKLTEAQKAIASRNSDRIALKSQKLGV